MEIMESNEVTAGGEEECENPDYDSETNPIIHFLIDCVCLVLWFFVFILLSNGKHPSLNINNLLIMAKPMSKSDKRLSNQSTISSMKI